MKIVYVTETYHPDTNGTVTYIDTAVRYLIERGHKVLICAPYTKGCEEPDEKLSREGFQIVRLPAMLLDPFIDLRNKRMTIPLYGNVTGKLKKVLDNFKPDLIHMHTELWLSYVAWRWARKNNVPTIMTAHTQMLTQWDAHIPWLPHFILKPALTFLFKPIYRGMDCLLAHTEDMSKYLSETHGINEPLEVCTTGIDPRSFDPVDPSHERANSVYFTKYPRIKNRHRLLFAGRITSEKNIDFLLLSLQELLKTRKDVELLLAGHSAVIGSYEKKAKELGVSDNLTFLGPVPHHEMGKLYAITDVFTFASKSETLGLATIEAIYFGVPAVVVSAIGSNTVLAGDKGGFLVEEDKTIFAGKVNGLLSDPTLYAKKKAEALSRHKELCFSHTVNSLVNIYERVVSNHPKIKDSQKVSKRVG